MGVAKKAPGMGSSVMALAVSLGKGYNRCQGNWWKQSERGHLWNSCDGGVQTYRTGN